MKLKAQTHPVLGDLAPDQWGDSLMCFRQIPGLADFAPEEAKETLDSLDPPDRKLVDSWAKPSKALIERCRDFDIFDALRGAGVFEVQFRRTPAGIPSEEQVAAFRFFQANEAAICRNLGDALLRSYRVARANDPHWFEQNDCPEVESVAELAKLAVVDGISFTNRSCEGEALVAIQWNVQWDPEHGFAMTLWQGQVIGVGGGGDELDLEDDALWNRSIMTEAERQAYDRVAASSAFEDEDDEEFDDDFDEDEDEDEDD